MTILKEEVREGIFNLAVPFQGGFYLFESGAGYQAILSFFDVSSKTIELISTEITRPCTNTPTIDNLGNLYYINLDSRVVGYKREGAGVSEIFSERAGDYIYADTIYFNNKLYHSARESFVEISF